jgi:PleD family two-component response regulator
VRIVIIDDRVSTVLSTAVALCRRGHLVLCAATAECGVAMARQERPDVILLGGETKGLDSAAILASLRADAATSAIPIVTRGAIQEFPRADAVVDDALDIDVLGRVLGRLICERVTAPHRATE